MKDVQWGSEKMKDDYVDLLRNKAIVGVQTAILFLVGAGGFIYAAFQSHSLLVFAGLIFIWIILLIGLSASMSYLNKKVRAIETYLGFYDRRHEVRHQVFCTNVIHCLTLHYFKSSHKEPS